MAATLSEDIPYTTFTNSWRKASPSIENCTEKMMQENTLVTNSVPGYDNQSLFVICKNSVGMNYLEERV